MGNHIDMIRTPQKNNDLAKSAVLTEPITFTPVSCVPKKRRHTPYLLLFAFCILCTSGFVLFPYFNAKVTATTETAPTVLLQVGTTSEPVQFSYGPQIHLAQEDFFSQTLNAFKIQKQSFIEADLSRMQIRYYENGTVVFEAPILTKGKEGSWWETPSGLYKVESRSENHFSSFGQVYTPWNIVFQGNFFIHGWPYYPNGTPVSSKYSGGCIRLDDADAKELFYLVDESTPILVYEKDFTRDSFVYTVPVPDIDASAYLIADIDSGSILAQEGLSTTVPIASITKLMTALVAAEYINLDKDFTVPQSAMASTSVARLQPGMTMSGYSYLLPLLLESSNVAANTLAQILGTERFVELMNKKADSLGMSQTTFADASGASPQNVSTAEDLLRLASYISNNRSFIYKISSGERVDTAYNVYPFGTLSNFNTIPSLEGFIGGKVGKTTAAKETIVSLYTMNIKGQERKIAFIVLGSNDNYKAVEQLYAYMKTQYAATSSTYDESTLE